MVHAITVDVEEFYHATNLESVVGPARWHLMPSRVERSTHEVLRCFAEHRVRGTFFVLGCVARRHPQLVREIQREGHEVASHGYAHRLVYEQTPRAFSRDVRKSKFLLEDITGEEVIGYRAPNFSITPRSSWAYHILGSAGYRYDSSVFPIRHPRYANRRQPASIFTVTHAGGTLAEFPLSVAELNILRFMTWRLPLAGGGYWRHLPLALLRWGLRRTAARQPLVCYFHPWELDSDQPRIEGLSALTHRRHYGGLRSFRRRLDLFLGMFPFVPLREVATSSSLPPNAVSIERRAEHFA